MRGKNEFTDTASVLLQFTHQIMFVCICLPVSESFVYVCVFTHVFMMQCLELPEYIARCVQSAAGLWLLYFFSPLIPPLAPHKWQFVKHGPLLALSLASQPFPARLLLSLICPPPLLFASLVLLPSFTFPPFPSLSSYFQTSCALCILGYLPLSACLSPSVFLCRSLSLSFALPSPCDFSSSLSRPLFSPLCPLLLLRSHYLLHLDLLYLVFFLDLNWFLTNNVIKNLFLCIQYHTDMHIKMQSLLNLHFKLHTL